MSIEKTYIAIDLKSFYASVECVERGLDPLDTNLVVADASRTDKTICLAVSPSLKEYGIPGRPRLFEVKQNVKRINAERLSKAPKRVFTGRSQFLSELLANPSLELDFITAVPQMIHYMDVSSKIYDIYLRYISPDDIHVYSIDEVFMDVTGYLETYGVTAKELAGSIIRDVLKTTGITATAGIGPNLYLCKIAMDIEAKHTEPDSDGVRIAELDEYRYRRNLWNYRPLSAFWKVGRKTQEKLEQYGIFTMGDIARCSVAPYGSPRSEELLYDLLGINAELLIDHAWGYEPCTIADIKAYKPESSGVSAGQVLMEPYPTDKARLIVKEMADSMVLDLVEKKLVTDQITLTLGYDISANSNEKNVETEQDWYGRSVPKHSHGSANLPCYTSSTKLIAKAVMGLFDKIVDPRLSIRRIYIGANRLLDKSDPETVPEAIQIDLFETSSVTSPMSIEEAEKEANLQQSILDLRNRFGKNAVLKGMNLEDGATAKDRNGMVGGHKG
ncbi:MAG: DNA methylase [Erysipelotrichaceae bacterium]|nr:DNA methylase [Erysipelotrichaceae bacterium]MBQ3412456.1 DNA methylase [Oscillospiraceae bacterium]